MFRIVSFLIALTYLITVPIVIGIIDVSFPLQRILGNSITLLYIALFMYVVSFICVSLFKWSRAAYKKDIPSRTVGSKKLIKGVLLLLFILITFFILQAIIQAFTITFIHPPEVYE